MDYLELNLFRPIIWNISSDPQNIIEEARHCVDYEEVKIIEKNLKTEITIKKDILLHVLDVAFTIKTGVYTVYDILKLIYVFLKDIHYKLYDHVYFEGIYSTQDGYKVMVGS